MKSVILNVHCTENLKHTFPEMKLCGLTPNFYIHVNRSVLFIPTIVFFEISIFLYCVRELLAQPQERREGQGTAAKQWLAAVPFPSHRSCS
jgi:hypothetical protein